MLQLRVKLGQKQPLSGSPWVMETHKAPFLLLMGIFSARTLYRSLALSLSPTCIHTACRMLCTWILLLCETDTSHTGGTQLLTKRPTTLWSKKKYSMDVVSTVFGIPRGLDLFRWGGNEVHTGRARAVRSNDERTLVPGSVPDSTQSEPGGFRMRVEQNGSESVYVAWPRDSVDLNGRDSRDTVRKSLSVADLIKIATLTFLEG